MKCPKCGYHSFDHLDDCKKCGNDLIAHKSKYNLRSIYSPEESGDSMTAAPAPAAEEAPQNSTDGSQEVDFGFDFLDEEEPAEPQTAAVEAQLGDDVSLNQPFGIDGESLPADDESTPAGKKDPGSEFGF